MGLVDIGKLGERTVTVQKVEPVEIDPVTKMVMIKPVLRTETIVQPRLTLEEAKLLEGVTWEPFAPEPGWFKCKVSGRRFLIDTPTHDALVQPVVEPPKPKKGKVSE